jgi:hypothetical protein
LGRARLIRAPLAAGGDEEPLFRLDEIHQERVGLGVVDLGAHG